jgi:hypothetical protein
MTTRALQRLLAQPDSLVFAVSLASLAMTIGATLLG